MAGAVARGRGCTGPGGPPERVGPAAAPPAGSVRFYHGRGAGPASPRKRWGGRLVAARAASLPPGVGCESGSE